MAEHELGSASLGTEVDQSGLNRGIDDAETRSRSGFLNIGRIMETALGGALLAIGQNIAASVGGFIKGGMEDAQASAVLMASTEKTIETMGNAAGRSAQEVADLAASLSDAAGKSLFGDDQIQQSQNLLLTFGEIKGETFDLASALTVDLAAALGGEPKQQAMMLGKALNSPKDAFGALGKAGLTFSDEQKVVITAMQEAGDMAGAQAFIIAELNKQVGGQAEAQAKAAGGMVQFKARLGEMAETVGAILLPVMNQFAAFLNDPLMPILENAATWLGENLPPMIDQAVAAVTNFTGGLGNIITQAQPVIDMISANLGPILAGLATVLAVVVIPAFVAWATAAGTAAVATIAAMAPVVLPILAIGAAVGVLFRAWTDDWGGIRTIITDFWDTTGRPIFDQLKVWLATNIPIALKALSDMWTGTLWPALQKVWTFIQDNILPILGALVTVGIAVVKKEIELLSALWSNVLWPALKKVWEFINDPLVPIFTKLAGVVRDTVGPALSWLKDNVLGPVLSSLGFIKDAVSGVIGFFRDLARSIDAIEIPAWLQGHSPPPMADWFGDIGEAAGTISQPLNAIFGALEGITGAAGRAAESMRSITGLADLGLNLGAGTIAGVFGGGTPSTDVNITLEEKGLRGLIQATVKEEFGTAGRNADTRSRTR